MHELLKMDTLKFTVNSKQAWRLIEYLESLCARILKAKYYPSGDLIDTSFIQNV